MLKIFSDMKAQRRDDQFTKIYRDLIHREAKMGGELFGNIPSNSRREFFCLDRHTWVWHEEWVDDENKQHIVTTRYDVHPSGIFKSIGGSHYQPVNREEASRLRLAISMYIRRAKTEIYNVA